MKSPAILTTILGALLLGCAKKPRLILPSAAAAPAMTASPARPSSGQEDARLRIESLLRQALQPVYFPFDRAELTPESRKLLGQAGDLLKQAPSIQVLIQGNTDERGTAEYNIALGDKRARAVQEYLVSYGVPASRLNIISYGEEKPAHSGHDEAAWAQNRRDDFSLSNTN